MAIYFHAAGSYEKFLQNESFIKDVNGQIKETGKRICYTISEEAKKIVASNEILAKTFGAGFDKVNGTLEWGFNRLEQAMQNVENAVNSLHSMLDAQLGHMLHYMEIQTMLQKGIWQELRIPDFKKEQRYYIQKGYDFYLDRLVKPALNSFIQAEESEIDFSEFRVLETIGHIYLGESECYNAEKALDYFLRAAEFAEPERKNPKKAAEYYMHASWAAYLLTDFSKAIELVQKSINLNHQLSRSHYFLAKYHACLNNKDECVKKLEKAISFDKNYCVLVDIDGDFNQIRNGVLELFDNLKNDAKARAKESLDEANNQLKSMNCWGVVTNTVTIAEKSVSEARHQYISNTYFGYLDVPPLCQNAIKIAQEAVNSQKQQLESKYNSSLARLDDTLGIAKRYEASKFASQEFDESMKLKKDVKKSSHWDSYHTWEKINEKILKAQELADRAVSISEEKFENERQKAYKRGKIIDWVKQLSPIIFSLFALMFFFAQNSSINEIIIAVMVIGPAVLVLIMKSDFKDAFGDTVLVVVAAIPWIIAQMVGKSTGLSIFLFLLPGLIGSSIIDRFGFNNYYTIHWGWNWTAFLLGPFWYIAHDLIFKGLILILITIVFIWIDSYFWGILMVWMYCGMRGNTDYRLHK